MSSQRDPFQHRPPDAKPQVMKQVLDEINAVVKRPEKPEKSFICGHDLKNIWAGSPARITTLLQPDQLSPDQINVIQLRMSMILSTLVSIGAMDCLANFCRNFFEPNSATPLLTDDDLPFTEDQLTFLDGGAALSQLFYQRQFRFKPVVLEFTKNQRIQLIENRMARLPFIYREQDIGEGSYGKVDHVEIPPGYFKEESGWVRDRGYEVAVKKIKVPEAFDEEVANLQILKESLTVHKRIMLHLATIKHGLKHYILLPYAQYGDLELFLHCGRGPTGEIKYDFKKRFNNMRSIDMTLPLLHQCWYLTDALKWLHGGITVTKNSSTVLCAHMDLKPANILIQRDDESIIGKWMISDFGISVLKEEAPQQGAGIVSIYDYYSQLTMNSQPKRQQGTYQAPEVKLTEDASKQKLNLTADQKGIGRRSDIWSYGCIFSEVLTFTLGGDKLVCEYQAARKGQDGNDYFYIEKEDRGQHLQAPGTGPKQYQVHPKVLQWLDNLCSRPLNSQRWIDCYVETIKQILVVDTQKRPDATKLQVLIDHVKAHVTTSFQTNNPVTCSLLRAKDEGITCDREESEETGAGPGYSIFSETSHASSSGSGSTLTTANVKPPHEHGIIIDGAVRRMPSKAISKELPHPGSSPFKATAVAETRTDSGIHVAYLAKSSVYIYKLDVHEQSASLEREVLLPQPQGWKGIALAGNFLAAWGYHSNERQLHILDVCESQRRTSLPRPYDVKMVVRVAVSKAGAAALISSQQILVVKVDPPLVPQPGQNFTDAAFNDAGDLLYAWAYGKHDSIYVWRCKDCVVNVKPESETYYKTEKIGKPYNTRVIPYNAKQGCIIAAQEKRFFAARLNSSSTTSSLLPTPSPSSSSSSSQPLQNNAKIIDAKAACVFSDHSLITIERRWPRTVLKEYKIEYHGGNAVLGAGVDICKLETGRDDARLVVGEWGEEVLVVVCNLNAVVEWVRIGVV